MGSGLAKAGRVKNPFMVKVELNEATGLGVLRLSLAPDALLLRSRYRALVGHYQITPEPVWFDLGKDMDLVREVPCFGAPMRLVITCYGVRPDGLLELVFRNWGDPATDGLPRV